MTVSVSGVVAMEKDAPVQMVEVIVPDPGPGEALVRVQACGVCHTDLHYKQGGINDEFPFLLGHEAAGMVEAVGPDVTEVEPGDFVILNWRAVCGQCRACRRGSPWYCFATHNATQPMTLADGTRCRRPWASARSRRRPWSRPGSARRSTRRSSPRAGLLGCGVMAGIGAAINTGGVTRGDSVAVIGCGGVGNAAILGADWPGRNDHRGGHRRPEAGVGALVRCHPHDQLACGSTRSSRFRC